MRSSIFMDQPALMQPSWKPASAAPRRVYSPVPATMGRARLGVPPNLLPIATTALGVGLTGAATYLGFRAALNDKGFPRILGWVVGAAAGWTTITSLLAIAAVAMTPTTTQP